MKTVDETTSPGSERQPAGDRELARKERKWAAGVASGATGSRAFGSVGEPCCVVVDLTVVVVVRVNGSV